MTAIAYEKYGDHLELPRDSYKPEWKPLTFSAKFGGTGKTVECWFRVALEYSAAAGLMPADYHSSAFQESALVWAGAVNPIALEGQRRLLAELTGAAD